MGAVTLVDEANPSSSGVLRIALPGDEALPEAKWMLQMEFLGASLPELGADATAGLVEVGLTHVAALSASPCPGAATPSSEGAPPAEVDAGASVEHPSACTLVDGGDRGLKIATQPNLELGVTRLQLFRAVGLRRSPSRSVELFPLGPLSLAVVAGKSLEERTEIVTWAENPVDLRILNGPSHRLRSGEQGRVIVRGVEGVEARANLTWRQLPATLFRSVRLKRLSARLSAKSEFGWLDREYEYSHGDLTITAPMIDATIGSGCDGKCIEVRYTAAQATLEGQGIVVEQRGPWSKKFEAGAAVAALILGLAGLFL